MILTLDEVLEAYSDDLKAFFSQGENAKLLLSNNFEELYRKWGVNIKNSNVLTALFIKSGLDFLSHMKEIPDYAFDDLDVKNITIPENIDKIGSYAFRGCGASNIQLPKNLTEIKIGAFRNCNDLVSLKYPDKIDFNLSLFPYLKRQNNLRKLFLPKNLSYDDFEKILMASNLSDIERRFEYAEYDIVLDGNYYRPWDIYDTIKHKKQEQRKNATAKIPLLWRVGDSKHLLTTTTYNKKQGKMNVSWRAKIGLGADNCPVYFKDTLEAMKFINNYNSKIAGYSQISNYPIYKARLSAQDSNFTKIETTAGECLVQSWKDNNIDSSCIIRKNIF